MCLLIPVLSQKFGVEDTMVAKGARAPVTDSVETKSMDLIGSTYQFCSAEAM